MQVVGAQFTNTSALHGNDVATFPDFPAEIRAPRGTLAGVSGFQVQFASTDIFTPGDTLNALVAMNPAALVTNVGDLEKGGILIVNSESFEPRDLKLARLDTNPLEDGSLDEYRVIKVRLDTLNREAVQDIDGLSSKLQDRCKNFFALGLIYWLFGRDLDATLRFVHAKFGHKPEIAAANEKSLRAGWYYGETTEAFTYSYQVAPAQLPPGQVPDRHGQPGPYLGPAHGGEIEQQGTVLRGLPHHAGQLGLGGAQRPQALRRPHGPGGGRDRPRCALLSGPRLAARWRSPARAAPVSP